MLLRFTHHFGTTQPTIETEIMNNKWVSLILELKKEFQNEPGDFYYRNVWPVSLVVTWVSINTSYFSCANLSSFICNYYTSIQANRWYSIVLDRCGKSTELKGILTQQQKNIINKLSQTDNASLIYKVERSLLSKHAFLINLTISNTST